MKPETEIRKLRRDLRDANARNLRLHQENNRLVELKDTYRLEAKEWKERFDVALRKIPDAEKNS